MSETDSSLEFEDKCRKLTAESFNVTEEEVKEIWTEVYIYKLNIKRQNLNSVFFYCPNIDFFHK